MGGFRSPNGTQKPAMKAPGSKKAGKASLFGDASKMMMPDMGFKKGGMAKKSSKGR